MQLMLLAYSLRVIEVIEVIGTFAFVSPVQIRIGSARISMAGGFRRLTPA
jgi:hypothetical protein